MDNKNIIVNFNDTSYLYGELICLYVICSHLLPVTMDVSLEDNAHEHKRVIIHLDIDYFYAQVEEILNPELRTKPLGVQQNRCVVTGNYLARGFGVKKLMPLSDAMRLCPELVLVNGEDLTKYRQMSNKVFNIMQNYTPLVEKLGMDENFLDVTDVVETRLNNIMGELTATGLVYPEGESLASCCCGCEKRLIMGSILAAEIRATLYSELGITTCGGIAHNKLLAKMVGSKQKPNGQSVLVPVCASDAMLALESVRKIQGIGERAEQQLAEIEVRTVQELQAISFTVLEQKFGRETAFKYKNWSRGVDNTPVIPSGKPKSISLEDSCKTISVRSDVEEKFRLLLIRLVNQVAEDGRIPLVVKIMLRKFDAIKKTSHRETKQATIVPSLFKELGDGKVILIDGGLERLLKIVMRLFEKVVDLKTKFNITLIGLAFSKFQERTRGSRSIANFLIKTDLEVQSITSIKSEGCPSITPSHNIFEKMRNYLPGSPIQMDLDAMSEASHASYSSDVSESEIEPSPKKTRISFLLSKRRCMPSDDVYDTASPSKLRVGDLRLNSRDMEIDSCSVASTPTSPLAEPCPMIIAPLSPFVHIRPVATKPISPLAETTSMMIAPTSPLAEQTPTPLPSTSDRVEAARELPPQCPSTVDPDVFKELPPDVQAELLTQWQQPVETPTTQPAVAIKPRATASSKGKGKTTLHRYFITNK